MFDKTKMTFLPLIVFIVWFSLSSSIFSQNKGKISGTVIDAETNEPIIGANVLIEETTTGAATDINGKYFIINLTPRTYTLVASYLGYQKVKIENVEVFSGQTTQINFELKSKAVESEEVTVVATRPIIRKDVSSSVDVVYGKELIATPAVLDVKDFVGNQAGASGLNIRGGSIDETAVMIDGVVFGDPTTNTPYSSIPLSSIQEVSLVKGGFNAEYGDIRSGLVSITTKDGDRNKYHASMDFRINLPHQKHFGPSMFSPENYYLRPFFDPQVTWDGTQNWPDYVRQQYPESFDGWNKWAQENSKFGLTPEMARELFTWTHTVEGKSDWGVESAEDLGQKPRKYGNKPDWNGEASLSGPLPLIGSFLGDLTFFGSYKGNKTYLAVPFSRDHNWQQDVQLKLTSHITNNIKLTAQGIYSKFEGVNQYWGEGVDGSYMTESRSLYAANDRNTYYYWESAFSPLDIENTLGSLSFEHVINPSMFYTAKLSMTHTKYFSNGYLTERDTTTLRSFGNVDVNEIPYGWTNSNFQQIVDQPDRRRFGGDGGMIWDASRSTTYNFKFDFIYQLDNINQLKSGIEAIYTDMNVSRSKIKSRSKEDVHVLELPSDWFSREFRAYPMRGAFYLQDKIEIEGMVANVGVRFDYFNTNTTDYFVDPYSKYYAGQYANVFLDSVPQVKTKGLLKVSPRLGIAFPIAETAKLYFNYGHFYGYPKSDDLYGLIRESQQKVTKVGNPATNLPRTISYELGVEINLLDMYLLHMAGYYKDVSDQLADVEYVSTSSISYETVLNQNIEDIRGFEVKLEKNRGDWFRGWINFTYLSSFSGDVGRNAYFEENERNIREGTLDFDASYRKPVVRPSVRANIDFFTPSSYGDWLGDWYLSLSPFWQSGSYYSYSPGGKDLPEFANNIHWPDYFNLDLRITKYFNVNGTTFSVFLEATNALNTKHFSPSTDLGFSDSFDREDYLRSLHLPLYSGAAYQAAGLTAGNDDVGDLRSSDKPYINDPNLTHSLWGLKRNIVLGVRVNL